MTFDFKQEIGKLHKKMSVIQKCQMLHFSTRNVIQCLRMVELNPTYHVELSTYKQKKIILKIRFLSTLHC
jgi:hypothetical protein